MSYPVFLNQQLTAIRLSVSVRTLEEWRKRNYGPDYLRVGNQIFYREEDLCSFLDECLVKTAKGDSND